MVVITTNNVENILKKKNCLECGKEFKAVTQKQVDSHLKQHVQWQHSTLKKVD